MNGAADAMHTLSRNVTADRAKANRSSVYRARDGVIGGVSLRTLTEQHHPRTRKRPARVKELMRNDTAAHVAPIRLWQCLCGASDLPKSDYQHVITCAECEALATEIGDARSAEASQ